MSTQCNNKPYLRSKYSNALTRQACVSCPSACSCDLGERSVMDQLMIKKWQQGDQKGFPQAQGILGDQPGIRCGWGARDGAS